MRTFLAGCPAVLALASGAQAAGLTFDTVRAVRKRATTEPADLLIMSDVAIDDMIKQGIARPAFKPMFAAAALDYKE